ncbi:hypothetical protein [Moritella viscosa]|uniref:Lipid-A-disaccharide synthase n=1 Tax=Moritella viscosa TaxID=80854 RepID=A0ABY1H8N3_9GAMM|nr:hypothetical protein [Moritella viscosa]SGY81364.1 Lipid-A-disaccharide synthase [Moritella viscosa]SGY81517.1 Lipid-A-disaccharide synthase [Moritella viscosa]SHO23995.1 Lipid-A-disaccharide synthase [Moritella viscosa]
MGIKDISNSAIAGKKSFDAAGNQYDYERLKQIKGEVWLNNKMIQDRVKQGISPMEAIQQTAQKMKFHDNAPTDKEFSNIHNNVRNEKIEESLSVLFDIPSAT